MTRLRWLVSLLVVGVSGLSAGVVSAEKQLVSLSTFDLDNPAPGEGEFFATFGVAVDSKDRIIVADVHRVQAFDSAGNFISVIGKLSPVGTIGGPTGGWGTGAGEFDFPQGVAVDSRDRIIVTEEENDRVQVLELVVGCAGEPASRVGTAAGEVIKGTKGRDVIAALGGNDTVRGFGGRDLICLGGGKDRAFGGPGNDKIYGQTGVDTVNGQNGADRVVGGPGNDRLRGDLGNDTLAGGPGRDRLNGGPGKDTLRGGPGNDTCNGGPGNDRAGGCENKISIP